MVTFGYGQNLSVLHFIILISTKICANAKVIQMQMQQ
jgi:hypothetical protein